MSNETPATTERATATKAPRSILPFVVVGTAIVIAAGLLGARSLLAASYKVPSGSMIPTIAYGEHILVNRTDKAVARGKVLVFRSPEHPEQEFVKRVVGIPGDVIELKGGALILNGKEVPRCAVGSWRFTADREEHEGDLFVESLDGAHYLVFIDKVSLALPEREGPWTVKQNEAFVVGDNRRNSHDSRMFYGGEGGGVPFSNVLGTVRPVGAIGLPVGAEALKEKLKACNAAL
jgi:signal peptidase I